MISSISQKVNGKVMLPFKPNKFKQLHDWQYRHILKVAIKKTDMKIELKTALIAGIISLVCTLITIYFSAKNIRSNENLWYRDLAKSKELEIQKIRIEEYPKILSSLEVISSKSKMKPTKTTIDSLGRNINEWLYSRGGLCASFNTREALRNLRNACFELDIKDSIPNEILDWRNVAFQYMRFDLDFNEDENWDSNNPKQPSRHTALEIAKRKIDHSITRESEQ